jgi:hypothetical protein
MPTDIKANHDLNGARSSSASLDQTTGKGRARDRRPAKSKQRSDNRPIRAEIRAKLVIASRKCVVADAVRCEPVSRANSLQTGNFTGSFSISNMSGVSQKQLRRSAISPKHPLLTRLRLSRYSSKAPAQAVLSDSRPLAQYDLTDRTRGRTMSPSSVRGDSTGPFRPPSAYWLRSASCSGGIVDGRHHQLRRR